QIIRSDLSHAVEGIIAAGRHLKEAKDDVGYGGWLPLLGTLHLGERTAQRLMKIAANEGLANPTHWVAFPASWRTLSDLAALPPEFLEAKIVNGTITPDLERKGVATLRNEAAVHHGGTPRPSRKASEKVSAAKEVEAAQAHAEEMEAARE